MRYAMLLIVFTALPVAGHPDTYYVPDDYLQIQSAINAATRGDTIIVRPGTYMEKVDFLGKDLILVSEQGADVTTIDGHQSGSVVTFANGEGRTAVLDGFTITNGTGTPGLYSKLVGGGIYCLDDSSPSIIHNTIRSNRDTGYGGGICCINYSKPAILYNSIYENSAVTGGGICCGGISAPLIKYNDIHDNMGTSSGGGITCFDYSHATIMYNRIHGNTLVHSSSTGAGVYSHSSAPLICANWIYRNFSDYDGGGFAGYFDSSIVVNNTIVKNISLGYGGGVYLWGSEAVITNNTICMNTAKEGGGGLYCGEWSDAVVTNSIFWGNTCHVLDQIMLQGMKWGCTLTVSHSDVQGGLAEVHLSKPAHLNWGSGMIESDPCFVDESSRDFHLSYDSPCRDAADNAAPGLPGLDHEGDPRVAHGMVDMGADEFYTHLYCTRVEGFSTHPHRMAHPEPGFRYEVKLVGLPGTTPVGLFSGSGFSHSPQATPWGDFHLDDPWVLLPLQAIPASGVLVLPWSLPESLPTPYHVYLQGLVGPDPDSLTNPFFMEVRD